jgi:nicotinate-nucleotide adenylyltransferase
VEPEPSDIPRVGVLGALFDPPHIGHLLLAQEAIWQLGLARVVLVPTGTPPHRAAAVAPAETRLRLTAAAAAGDPRLSVSRAELDRPGPSYTSDTLRSLQLHYPEASLVLLLGADQLAALGSWHEAERLPQLARLAVARRPGVALAGAERAAVTWIEMPLVDVSSSAIRARAASRRPIRWLVPEPVRALIEADGLYRGAAP